MEISTLTSEGRKQLSDHIDVHFHREKHIRYFRSCLQLLPKHYMDIDTSRMTVIYFATVALDMLQALDSINRNEVIDYIYMLQIEPQSSSSSNSHSREFVEAGQFGFIGGSFTNHHLCGLCTNQSSTVASDDSICHLFKYHQGHLAMTYTALATLLTLGDDLSRVNRSNILIGMKKLQTEDGSFYATASAGGEHDVRFLYCACAISYMLQDWSGIDCDKAVDYIQRCITYEGGIAVIPGGEAQGGATYCALASLKLMNRLDVALTMQQQRDIIYWCEARQCGGYEGRTNKVKDSCYSFWVGGSLSLLEMFHDTDLESTRVFLLRSCQQQHIGGFSKYPEGFPDILHSFYSICWLSIAGQDHLRQIDTRLGICAEKASIILTRR